MPPGKELIDPVDPVDLVVGDAAEDISEPCLRIDTVKLCSLDQRAGNGSGSPTVIRAHKLQILIEALGVSPVRSLYDTPGYTPKVRRNKEVSWFAMRIRKCTKH